jgi:hypothetical protein
MKFTALKLKKMSCYTNDIDHVAPMLDELSEIRNGRHKCATCVDCAADFIARHVLLDVISGKNSITIIAKETMSPNVIGVATNVIGVTPNVIGVATNVIGDVAIGWYLDGHLIARVLVRDVLSSRNDEDNAPLPAEVRRATINKVLSLLNRGVVTFTYAARELEYTIRAVDQ